MPPKRASTSKRKASNSEDEDEPSQAQTKKSKLSSATENVQPTNKVLPVHISFPPRIPGTLRIATWNVCGLAASQRKVCQVGLCDLFLLNHVRVSNTTWRLKIQTS